MTLFRHRVSGPGSAGDVWVSTLHTTGVASLNIAHAAWADFVTNTINAALKPMWAPTTTATQLVTDQLDDITWKNVAQFVSAINIVGTSAGNAVSPDNCIVIGLRTDLPTRAGRGRMFLPSPSATHYQASGRFVEADCATLADAWANSMQNLRNTLEPVIAHRGPKTTTPITRVTVGDIAGQQRRRSNKATQTYSSTFV
jgi:hypothetical protein